MTVKEGKDAGDKRWGECFEVLFRKKGRKNNSRRLFTQNRI